MNPSRKLLGVAGLALLASALSAGCATKGYVRRQVDDLRQGEAQESTRLDRSIGEVRNSADQAMQRAQIAYETAAEARDLALGKMGLEEVGQFTARFGFDRDELDAAAQAELDRAAGLAQERPGTLIDIYGFTDQTGDARYNLELGQRRAEAVLRYLADKAPGNLSRFAAVSYGEGKPAFSNGSAEGRAQNRRVLVSVLERKAVAAKPSASEGQPSVAS